MNQPCHLFSPSLRSPGRLVAALLLSGIVLTSCGGDSTSSSTVDPPQTTDPATIPTTSAVSPAAAPNTPTGGSVFTSDNFTITITGFGLDAAYKGCDTQGQCLEIARASSHQNGNYTWENNGYLYIMDGVVGGNYRLEVRDPQGKILVDELVEAVHNSQSNTPDAPSTDTVEMVDVTLQNLTQGDRACYLDLIDSGGNSFSELGSFDVCGQTNLIGQVVRITLQESNVMAESCQGDPDCTATELVPLVVEMRAQ